MKVSWKSLFAVTVAGLVASPAFALDVPMYAVAQMGNGKSIGTITLVQRQYGLMVVPNLKGLPPGIHGFHIHTAPSCDNFGEAAQGHFDPQNTSAHLGPYNDNGHQGDMPVLIVNKDGSATLPTLVPKIALQQAEGHSIIIHAGSDNYTDTPPLGGGGDRIACGIIPIEPGVAQAPAAAVATSSTTTTTSPATTTAPQTTTSTTITTPQTTAVPAMTAPQTTTTTTQAGTPTNPLPDADKLKQLEELRKAREQLLKQPPASPVGAVPIQPSQTPPVTN